MTQLTTAAGYDTSNLVFSEPEVGKIPDSKLTYQRINISTKYPDGTSGRLILRTADGLFSAGVREQTSLESGKL